MTERIEKAKELHKKGYNCAQCVFCAYADLVGVDEQTAYKVSEGFGLGMGQMEVCGALSGAYMLAGMQNSGGIERAGQTKGELYKLTRAMGEAFREKNQSILCKELKGVKTGTPLRSCEGCIEDAAKLVEEHLKLN